MKITDKPMKILCFRCGRKMKKYYYDKLEALVCGYCETTIFPQDPFQDPSDSRSMRSVEELGSLIARFPNGWLFIGRKEWSDKIPMKIIDKFWFNEMGGTKPIGIVIVEFERLEGEGALFVVQGFPLT